MGRAVVTNTRAAPKSLEIILKYQRSPKARVSHSSWVALVAVVVVAVAVVAVAAAVVVVAVAVQVVVRLYRRRYHFGMGLCCFVGATHKQVSPPCNLGIQHWLLVWILGYLD